MTMPPLYAATVAALGFDPMMPVDCGPECVVCPATQATEE